MDTFLATIKQVGIFMILSQGIMHFSKEGSYEKYFKLLISIMVIIQLFLPIMNLFSKTSMEGFEQQMKEISKNLFYNSEQLEQISEQSELKLEEGIKAQIEQSKAEEEIQIEKIEVNLNE